EIDLHAHRPARFVVAAPEAGSVVDQYVHTAEIPCGGLQPAADLLRLRKVAGARAHAPAERPHRLRGRLQRLLLARAARDVRPGGREGPGNGEPDAAARSGYERAAPVEIDLHRCPLSGGREIKVTP